MSYTIWLLPKEQGVRDYLKTLVARMAANNSGPVFEPHMTLVGDVEQSLVKISGVLQEVAKTVSPLTVSTGELSYSTTYYQCVFVRVRAHPGLMDLFIDIRKALGLEAPALFMPHISLFYGNLDMYRRADMLSTISFEPQTFTIDQFVITLGGEHPPDEWDHLETIPFVD